MPQATQTDYPVHELITKRWSPVGFATRNVSTSDLCSLFEAARWAASSFNEQPWNFLIATKDNEEEFTKALSCLVEANQVWAQAASALVFCGTSLLFGRNNKPNSAALHDLGLAVGNLSLEATARGLSVHQMIGILPDRALELYSVPDNFQIVTALAIGYATDPANLPESLRQRDEAPRRRKRLTDFVFSGKWGQTARMVQG